jgi:hypothetical protein
MPELRAQTSIQGDNAICNSTSDCSAQLASPAFIDASVFSGGTNNDVCLQIRNAFHLGNVPAAGAVIDARGASGAANIFNCSGTPWYDPNTKIAIMTPSEIILPAGQINISEPWVLPNQTRVFGVGMYGDSIGSNGTTLSACSAGGSCSISSSGGPIVQFGGTDIHHNNFCTTCNGISVEQITLNGADVNSNPQNFVGILNRSAQNGSYVDQVTIENIATPTGSSAIGLQIGASGASGAINSGPYTNIFFNGDTNKNNAFEGTTECVEIYQSATLGLHGITCTAGNVQTPTAAIYLDASNTTIEDAHIENFTDGIQVGANQTAQGDTLANISSGGAARTSILKNIIHVCNGTNGCGSSGITVSDLGIFASVNASSIVAPTAVLDDQTGHSTNSAVGFYTEGSSFAGGRPLFSTAAVSSNSNNPLPSWIVGDSSPSEACQVGAIFSNVAGTSGSTLFVCYKSGSTGAWRAIE